jgi:hypothetical protein
MDIYSVQFILCDLAGNYMSPTGDLFLVEICALDFDGPGKFTVNKSISMLCEFVKTYTNETLGKTIFIADVQVTEEDRPDMVEVSLSTLTRQKYCRQV